jgi:hypothetical protein
MGAGLDAEVRRREGGRRRGGVSDVILRHGCFDTCGLANRGKS